MPAFPRVLEVIQTIFNWLNVLTRNGIDLQTRVKVLEDVLAKLEEENRFLKSMAYHDSMTGLKNRRGFEEVSAPVYALAERTGKAFCVCLVDVDHFKHVNDTYGHAVGDVVLHHVATVLTRLARGSDCVARWGGEEFILLLPETSSGQAIQFLDRVRLHLAQNTIEVNEERIQVRVSIGIAEWSTGKGMDTLISEADSALYRAKNSGRNRVCIYENGVA